MKLKYQRTFINILNVYTVDYLFKPFIYSCLHALSLHSGNFLHSLNHFSFFLSLLFFHCCLGPDYFTLQFSISDKVTTVFTFQCNDTAKWDKLVDRKVNQYLVSAIYLGEIEVLRTEHINSAYW